MPTSYNGWPASKDPAEIGIKSYAVPGTNRKLTCAEAVAPLLVGFAAEFHALIEPIDKGEWDEGGYAFREVTSISNPAIRLPIAIRIIIIDLLPKLNASCT